MVITFTIPTVQDAQDLVSALCVRYGYIATLEGGTVNPETPAQFAKRMVIQDWTATVLWYRNAQAAAAVVAAQPPSIT
jgi:hypothetical protein